MENHNLYSLQANPYYQIIYFLQSVCQFTTGMIFGNAGNVLASTVIIASGQFDILLCSLKNLRATAMTFNGFRLRELRLDNNILNTYFFSGNIVGLFVRSINFKFRKLQSMIDPEFEEVNQYYLAAELMDDIEQNTAKMQDALERDPGKFQPSNEYMPQDNYLSDLAEELKHAIFACIQHHQMLIELDNILYNF